MINIVRLCFNTVFSVFILISGSGFAQEPPDFTRLVEDASPAVVNVSTTQKVKQPHFRMPKGKEGQAVPDEFGELFRRFFGDRDGEDDSDRDFDAQSLGSAFIISQDGYLLTNHHVVKDADEIIVRLNDRREMPAKVVGSDPRSDIALLKISAKDLPVLRMGDPSKLKVGEWVLAIGSPFGFDRSATAGIVSALGRSLPSENYVPFIQTDVAINPGNSGGPLFNLAGEVIGVNSQIYSRTGGFMGLSFAIPIDVAMDVVNQIKGKGYVSRGWLGVMIQDVTRELAESFHMERPEGALVAKVLPGGPAGAGGIEVGDVILEFNGKRISQSANLPPLVGRTLIGSSVELKVMRAGELRTLSIKIGELPNEDEKIQSSSSTNITEKNRLGMVVTDLTAEQRSELGIKEEGGILVSEVGEGPAKHAGLRQGDVILMINHARVTNASNFQSMIKELPAGKTVPMLIHRSSGVLFLAIKIPN
ncbi:putative periplasmic serine endoprotease DegP-like [Gammaproteobacteria bacterium]